MWRVKIDNNSDVLVFPHGIIGEILLNNVVFLAGSLQLHISKYFMVLDIKYKFSLNLCESLITLIRGIYGEIPKFKISRTRQMIRYRATAALRRPQMEQLPQMKRNGGYKTNENII